MALRFLNSLLSSFPVYPAFFWIFLKDCPVVIEYTGETHFPFLKSRCPLNLSIISLGVTNDEEEGGIHEVILSPSFSKAATLYAYHPPKLLLIPPFTLKNILVE